MARELGWSRPNERELSKVANELEKCVATDTTRTGLKKVLRKEWTVKELYRGNLSLFTLSRNMSGIFTLLFLPLVTHLPLVSLKHFSLTSSSLITLWFVFPLWKYDQHAWECVVQTVGYSPSLILATETTVNSYIPLPLSFYWTQTTLKIMKLINDATRLLPNFVLLRV